MPQPFTIKHRAVTNSAWTPISPTKTSSAMSISIMNDELAFAVRTDENDPTSELQLKPSGRFAVGRGTSSFIPDEVCCYVKLTGSTTSGTAIVIWTR